jgi:hypothetical protein
MSRPYTHPHYRLVQERQEALLRKLNAEQALRDAQDACNAKSREWLRADAERGTDSRRGTRASGGAGHCVDGSRASSAVHRA